MLSLVKTTTFSATSAGVAITVLTRCRRVEVWEQSAGVQVNHRAPGNGDTGVPVYVGQVIPFQRQSPGVYGFGVASDQTGYGDPGIYQPGDILGYIYTNSGTVTMCQREML